MAIIDRTGRPSFQDGCTAGMNTEEAFAFSRRMDAEPGKPDSYWWDQLRAHTRALIAASNPPGPRRG